GDLGPDLHLDLRPAGIIPEGHAVGATRIDGRGFAAAGRAAAAIEDVPVGTVDGADRAAAAATATATGSTARPRRCSAGAAAGAACGRVDRAGRTILRHQRGSAATAESPEGQSEEGQLP